MQPISYARHQFPPEVIRHAIWLYLRFTLSYRDVEELLAERGLDVSYETVRRWVLKFGPAFARNLRRLRPRPSTAGVLRVRPPSAWDASSPRNFDLCGAGCAGLACSRHPKAAWPVSQREGQSKPP
jgi:hypothetical protein